MKHVPLVLRSAAVAIAIAALVDPVWTAGVPVPSQLIAIDLTDAASDAVVANLEAAAPRWQIVRRRATGNRLPCGSDERCVVIADGSRDATVPSDAGALSLIQVRHRASPNLSLQSAVVSSGHAMAAGTARLGLARTGAITSSEIRIRDGDAVVGTAIHKWDGQQTATIDVPWWPLDLGARALRIEAVPVPGESSVADNTLDVAASINATPIPVLMFDARPAWGSTFVRRALEDDERFVVRARSRVAPAVTAGTARGWLDPAALEDAPVVIVSGLDALTATDAALLERYVSQRGGSLIVLPERRVDGPAARLIGDGWREQLTPAPLPIGPLRATEILRLDRAPIAATVVAYAETSPSVVALPEGRGRVIVSGAMDAWRYRDTTGFDRFWTSLVADAAIDGSALTVDVDTALAGAGERVPFTLRYRALTPSIALDARGTLRCGNEVTPLRLWPSGAIDEFAGELPPMSTGQCRIEVRVGDRLASASVAVVAYPARGTEATLAKLERITRAAGGVVVEAGKEAEIAAALDDSSAESSRIVSVRPMHSPWWLLPFATALSAEWWLRRRAGFA